jgi:RNA polymerase sigma-70 factor, ECF subfamily
LRIVELNEPLALVGHRIFVTDEELAKGVALGEEPALRELIERFHRPVLRYLWQISGHREDAEDLAAQTLLRVRKEIKSYRGEGALRGWVFRAAYRELLRHRRWQTVRRLWLARQSQEQPRSSDDDSIVLTQALQMLSEDHRAAFLLTSVEGLTIEEAAQVLGVPAGTIKSRRHHARLKLRQILCHTYGEAHEDE